MSIPDLERAVTLAADAVDAAYQARNEAGVKLHSYRLGKAAEALTAARIEQGEM